MFINNIFLLKLDIFCLGKFGFVFIVFIFCFICLIIVLWYRRLVRLLFFFWLFVLLVLFFFCWVLGLEIGWNLMWMIIRDFWVWGCGRFVLGIGVIIRILYRIFMMDVVGCCLWILMLFGNGFGYVSIWGLWFNGISCLWWGVVIN